MFDKQLTEYSDEYIKDLDSNLKDKIDELMNYFNEYEIDHESYPELPKNKVAYPNEHYMSIPGQQNLPKWLESLKSIKYYQKAGLSQKQAIGKVTGYWSDSERFNFLNWIKFYEEGNHLKYKRAQVNVNGLPHYLLDLNPQKPIEKNDQALSKLEKKQIIERQRNKIISRLDSAEKLLRSEDGNLFAGDELESLIDSIYSLKKKIQVVNKLSLNNNLYEDMIVRQSNFLKSNGFVKGAKLLYSIAQDANEQDIQDIQPNIPEQSQNLNPIQDLQPQTGGLPNLEPSATHITNDPGNISPAIDEFLENLDTGAITTKEDISELDSNNLEDEVIIVEAQAVPQAAKTNPLENALNPKPVQNPSTVVPNKPQVTNDNKQIKVDDEPKSDVVNDSHIDTMLNSLFKNVTIADAIKKLEDLSNVFNAREIPRQLALVDMMLNSLGLAQYFPSLPEATEKALDSHNYISTRVDDILSKLKNTTNDHGISLTDHNSGISKQDTTGLQDKLESEEKAEDLRKQRRKQKEQMKLENEFKEEPEIDLSKELETNNPVDPNKVQPSQPTKPKPIFQTDKV